MTAAVVIYSELELIHFPSLPVLNSLPISFSTMFSGLRVGNLYIPLNSESLSVHFFSEQDISHYVSLTKAELFYLSVYR